MPTTPHAHTIEFAGRVLAPGDTFEPFPGERPGYLVTFEGVRDGHVVLRDAAMTLTAPLDEIADA